MVPHTPTSHSESRSLVNYIHISYRKHHFPPTLGRMLKILSVRHAGDMSSHGDPYEVTERKAIFYADWDLLWYANMTYQPINPYDGAYRSGLAVDYAFVKFYKSVKKRRRTMTVRRICHIFNDHVNELDHSRLSLCRGTRRYFP